MPNDTLPADAAALKKELLQDYWNDPDKNLMIEFGDFCAALTKNLKVALSQGITQPE